MLNLLTLDCLATQYSGILLILSNYTILTVLSFIVFNGLKVLNLNATTSNNNGHLIYVLFSLFFFLNLAGIPPLPGFFIKINFLLNLVKYINLYLVIILIITNFTIFYFYIQFYKTVSNYSKIRVTNIDYTQSIPTLIVLVVMVNFYPLYNLMVFFIL